MLSLVYGPVDIVSIDPLDTALLVSSGNGSMWVDGQGLYVFADGGSTHVLDLYMVQFDGRAVRVGHRFGSGGGGLAWCAIEDVPAFATTAGSWFKARLPSTAQIGEVLGESVGLFGAVMPDRRLQYVNGGVNSLPYASTTATAECTLTSPPALSGSTTMAYAGERAGKQCWWCIDQGTDGQILLYDATDQSEGTVARTTLGVAVRAVGYSIHHDLFIAVRRDTTRTPNVDQVYVYATEPVAASLSAPTFSPSPKRGARSSLTTRVLGALSEPCSGRNVTFAVTAGTLDRTTVATDAAGYATTAYDAPTDSAPSGATVTATLEE